MIVIIVKEIYTSLKIDFITGGNDIKYPKCYKTYDLLQHDHELLISIILVHNHSFKWTNRV